MHWFHFARLYALLLLPAVAGLFWLGSWLRRRSLRRMGEAHLLEPLREAPPPWIGVVKAVCVLLALAFAVLAWARPQWGVSHEEVTARGVDVVFAVDTSLSMLAEDVRPSRIARARLELSALADALQGNRIGVVAFAGSAAPVCPLTLDGGAVHLFLDSLSPGMVSPQGTRLGSAVHTALKLLDKRPGRSKVIVLVTDGEDHDSDPLEAAREAKKENAVLYTVGLGSDEGTPIPLRSENGAVGEYKKTKKGDIVLSKLDESLLRQMAHETGGRYFRADRGMDLQGIQKSVDKMKKTELGSRLGRRYKERFMAPLGVAVFFLGLELFIPSRKKSRKLPKKR